MIRVIARDLNADTGVGSLIGDFQPDQIAPLLKLMQTIPGFCVDPTLTGYIRVAEHLVGGPVQWVERDGRLVVEILVEEVPDQDANQSEWVIDETSFIGIRSI